MTAVDPPDRQPRHLTRDRPSGRVRLLETEQRVGHPLDEHGRCVQPGQQWPGAVGVQEGEQLGARSARLGRREEQPADDEVKAPADGPARTTPIRARPAWATPTRA